MGGGASGTSLTSPILPTHDRGVIEPLVQFARAEDGTSIAYWSTGIGPPLVHLSWLPWSHAQLEWRNDEVRRWLESLAGFTRLIRYDPRGTGLSTRDVPGSVGIEAQVSDVEAVLRHLKLSEVALFAPYHAGPAAISFAIRHPETVKALILWCTYACGADYYESERVQSILSLIEDWELYTETGAHAFVGWSAGETAHEFAEIMRAGATPEMAKRYFEAMRDVDCRPQLSQLNVPTLVMHPRRFPLIELNVAQDLASSISGAQFLALEGDSLAPMMADMPRVLSAIRDLLGQAWSAADEKTADAELALLTPREREVLALLASGRSNRDIAEMLVLSPRTVERHVLNIYGKIEVTNRSQATAFALSRGILPAGQERQ
jgi:DNA-binding CsgD family transcriptional regulator/pimeloyl-ACP methyl ester carboxylesterase